MEVKEKLGVYGKSIRVVSLPCIELFEKQSNKYKDFVIPDNVENRVCLEAGSGLCIAKYAGIKGKVININNYGKSAPMNDVFNYFGLTPENVITCIKKK